MKITRLLSLAKKFDGFEAASYDAAILNQQYRDKYFYPCAFYSNYIIKVFAYDDNIICEDLGFLKVEACLDGKVGDEKEMKDE